jgi:hypothetical protein
MPTFIPDTNVWKHIGKDEILTAQFEKSLALGNKFSVGPPVLIELVRGGWPTLCGFGKGWVLG